MKASPILLVLCLSAAPACAGGHFGGDHVGGDHVSGDHFGGDHFRGGHGHDGGLHGLAPFYVNAVSDIEPGPLPPPSFAPAPPPEPATFTPPQPVYVPVPFRPAPPRVWRPRPGPQILYLRKPSNRPRPVVIYGAG